MFSFHKPKIYRSLQGCCICRAKSSSSRFTDSKRYEDDFEKCFNIDENRQGEICNACVLLVKRWKKLPKDSLRNWEHVVDARAGPGTKSMNKIKNKAAGILAKDPLKEERFKKKHKHKHPKKQHIVKQMQANALAITKPPGSPSQFSDDIGDDCMSEDMQSYDADYTSNSDVSEYDTRSSRSSSVSKSVGRRKKAAPNPLRNPLRYSSFLDLNYWKKREVCCGIIFVGANGECLLDASLYKPCRACKVSRAGSNQNIAQSQSVRNSETQHRAQSNRVTSLSQSQLMVQPPIGGYVGTDPPAPVEIEPMSYGLDDHEPYSPNIPVDCQTEMASAPHCSVTRLRNLTSIDNLTLPMDIEPLQANMTPIMQQSPRFIQMAV